MLRRIGLRAVCCWGLVSTGLDEDVYALEDLPGQDMFAVE